MVLPRLLLASSASAALALGGGGFRELGPKDQLRLVKMFDAPRDALKTAIAQSAHPRLCTAERECPLWVFQRARGEWAELLDTEGRAFRVLPTHTNRYRDIAVLGGSAARIFRFNGTSC